MSREEHLSPTGRLECYGFGEVKHQKLLVKAGKTGIVYDFYITGDYAAFIDELVATREDGLLGNNGDYIDWFIDGNREDRLNRNIPLATPKEFQKPLLAKRHIQFVAFNGDKVNDHTFEVVCDGQICRPKPEQ